MTTSPILHHQTTTILIMPNIIIALGVHTQVSFILKGKIDSKNWMSSVVYNINPIMFLRELFPWVNNAHVICCSVVITHALAPEALRTWFFWEQEMLSHVSGLIFVFCLDVFFWRFWYYYDRTVWSWQEEKSERERGAWSGKVLQSGFELGTPVVQWCCMSALTHHCFLNASGEFQSKIENAFITYSIFTHLFV